MATLEVSGEETMMSNSENIIDVSESDFEYNVLIYSQTVPVLVDFWAEWCGPCRVLGPILERLAKEAAGSFRLAKINVDENPNLARRYNVSSIPMVKAFRDGHVVSEFVGALPEVRIREFLRALAPSPMDLQLEKGTSLLEMKEWVQAEKIFGEYLQAFPSHSGATLGLIKSLLQQGRAKEALNFINKFPEGKDYNRAENLKPLATALARLQSGDVYSENPIEAAYMNALRLVMRANHAAAMDGMLDVLRQDKQYRQGEVRQVMVGIFELLGDENPLTRQYRNELAMILF
jgi:putative thioredoxin